MTTLQGALPDATQDELLAYEDDCAICKEPMARANRLPCAHLFHLACLRSWLGSRTATHNLQRLVDVPTASPGTNETQAQVPRRQDSAPVPSPPLTNLAPVPAPHWNAPVTSTWTGTSKDVGPVGVVGAIDEVNGSTDIQNTGGGLGRLHLMMRQLSGSGSGHGHSLWKRAVGIGGHLEGRVVYSQVRVTDMNQLVPFVCVIMPRLDWVLEQIRGLQQWLPWFVKFFHTSQMS